MNSVRALLDAWRFLSLLPFLAQLFVSFFKMLLCQPENGFDQQLVQGPGCTWVSLGGHRQMGLVLHQLHAKLCQN